MLFHTVLAYNFAFMQLFLKILSGKPNIWCGTRSDCSLRSSLIWVCTICIYAISLATDVRNFRTFMDYHVYIFFINLNPLLHKQEHSHCLTGTDKISWVTFFWIPFVNVILCCVCIAVICIPVTCRGRQHSFMEIYHEIFSTVVLSLPLIQEGQLSVSGERMCTILVNRLED